MVFKIFTYSVSNVNEGTDQMKMNILHSRWIFAIVKIMITNL